MRNFKKTLRGEKMSKAKNELKQLPIIVVPDKSYIGDDGNIIPTDVILIADPTMYERMKAVLEAWGKEEMDVPGQRGEIDG